MLPHQHSRARATFPHGPLLLLLFLKERLLYFIVNACEPILRTSGAVPKMNCLFLKLACPFLGSPQLERKLVREVHGSLAVFLRHIGSPFAPGQRCHVQRHLPPSWHPEPPSLERTQQSNSVSRASLLPPSLKTTLRTFNKVQDSFLARSYKVTGLARFRRSVAGQPLSGLHFRLRRVFPPDVLRQDRLAAGQRLPFVTAGHDPAQPSVHPHKALRRPSACGTAAALPPDAISCLAAFRTPANGACDKIRAAGVRKPAQNRL